MKDTDKPVIFFTYYGSKKRLLSPLYSLKPININTTIEACAGSAVWTINKPKYGKEILNDLSVEIYNLLKLMADKEKGRELVKRLLKIEYSRDVFNKALEAKKNKFENISEMDMAVMSYILLTQSFNATGKSWRSSDNQEAYTKRIASRVEYVQKRLEGVEVTNKNCIDLVDEHRNEEDTLILLDVPYVKELRGAKEVYNCEMSTEEHQRMLDTIRDCKCKIILCGYKSENSEDDLYDKNLLHSGWNRYLLGEIPKSCQITKKKRDIAKEWVWINYDLPPFAKYKINKGTKNM